MRNLKALALALPSLLLTPLDFGVGCDPDGCGLIFGFAWGYVFPPIPEWLADVLFHLGHAFGVW